MTIDLPTEAQQFVKKQLATGHYADESEVLAHALSFWEQYQQQEIKKIQEGYAQGKADLEAGRSREINTPEDAAALKADIIERGKAQLAERKPTAH